MGQLGRLRPHFRNGLVSMTTPSRFQRTPVGSTTPEPTSAAGPTPAAPGAPSVAAPHATAPQGAALQDLQERLRKVQERRMRREIDRDRWAQDVAECEAEARALGVSSIEELRQRVEQIKAEDAAALRAFETALDQEEALLNSIDQQLAQVDALRE